MIDALLEQQQSQGGSGFLGAQEVWAQDVPNPSTAPPTSMQSPRAFGQQSLFFGAGAARMVFDASVILHQGAYSYDPTAQLQNTARSTLPSLVLYHGQSFEPTLPLLDPNAHGYVGVYHGHLQALAHARLVRPEIEAAARVFRRWGLTDAEASRILGFGTPLAAQALSEGLLTLTNRDQADRLRLLLDVYEGAFALFSDPRNEVAFLKMPQAKLGGQSVLDLMLEGSMLALIRARDFVSYFNGRS